MYPDHTTRMRRENKTASIHVNSFHLDQARTASRERSQSVRRGSGHQESSHRELGVRGSPSGAEVLQGIWKYS